MTIRKLLCRLGWCLMKREPLSYGERRTCACGKVEIHRPNGEVFKVKETDNERA